MYLQRSGYAAPDMIFEVATGPVPTHTATLAPIVFVFALGGFFGWGYLIPRYEDRLTVLAERALTGPLVVALRAKDHKVSLSSLYIRFALKADKRAEVSLSPLSADIVVKVQNCPVIIFPP